MKALLSAYKVLATVVGLSIVTLVVVGIPLKYVHSLWPSVLPVGSAGQELGASINLYPHPVSALREIADEVGALDSYNREMGNFELLPGTNQ